LQACTAAIYSVLAQQKISPKWKRREYSGLKARERKISSLFSSPIAREAVHSLNERGCTYCDSNIQRDIPLLVGFQTPLRDGRGI